MSADSRGFWLCHGADMRFVAITDRDDLDGEDAQQVLRIARDASRGAFILCGCVHSPSRAPLLPRLRPASSLLSCVRERIEEHGSNCVFGEIYGQRDNAKFSPSIFAKQSRWPVAPNASSASVGGEFRTITFQHLCSHFVSESFLAAFCAANPKPPFRMQPTIEDFGTAWMRAAAAKRFAGDLDAAEAAQSCGVCFKFGFVFAEIQDASGDDTLLAGHWFDGEYLASSVNVVATEVLVVGMGSVTGRSGLVPPPYLAVATCQPDGRITQLWLRPIWTDGEVFFIAESHSERRHFESRKQNAATVAYRPFLRRELDLLTRHLRLSRFFRWDHKPDILEFPENGLPTILELRGFREGAFPDYDRNFLAAQSSYRRLGDLFATRTIDLWRLPEVSLRFADRSWLFRKSRFAGISTAAAVLIESTVESTFGSEDENEPV